MTGQVRQSRMRPTGASRLHHVWTDDIASCRAGPCVPPIPAADSPIAQPADMPVRHKRAHVGGQA